MLLKQSEATEKGSKILSKCGKSLRKISWVAKIPLTSSNHFLGKAEKGGNMWKPHQIESNLGGGLTKAQKENKGRTG